MTPINPKKIIKIDAKDQILGRIAVRISDLLRGKGKCDFSYNKDSGDKVNVYNVGKIKVTGKKLIDKKYYRRSKYLGSLKETSLSTMMQKNPTKALELAVRGMLPKNRLQKIWLKKLTLLEGELK